MNKTDIKVVSRNIAWQRCARSKAQIPQRGQCVFVTKTTALAAHPYCIS